MEHQLVTYLIYFVGFYLINSLLCLSLFYYCKSKGINKEKEFYISWGFVTKFYIRDGTVERLCRLLLCLSRLFVPTVFSAVGCNQFVISSNVDNTNSFVINLNLLFSVSTTLVRSMDYYFVNQFINHFCS